MEKCYPKKYSKEATKALHFYDGYDANNFFICLLCKSSPSPGGLRRKAGKKRENFKLLCDERVPRNIVYVMTISIMKHQPPPFSEEWPRERRRWEFSATDFVPKQEEARRQNSMSFIANNIIVECPGSPSFLPRFWRRKFLLIIFMLGNVWFVIQSVTVVSTFNFSLRGK